jgi:predicted nucleic acid-binding Zn ribbon protein
MPAADGQPGPASDPALVPRAERLRRAAAALAEAIADARARGEWPSAGRPGTHGPPGNTEAAENVRNSNETGTGGTLRGTRRGRRDDPQPLGTAIGGLLSDQGWKQRAAVGAVFGNWAAIVGADLAGHTRPDGFADGELTIAADSTAWATQVRLLASMLVRRLNAELGHGTVRRVKVRGPSGPARRGGWRVPGSRGPGDTYG